MNFILIFIVIVSLIQIKSTFGCSCRFRHNQADFCNSDIVFSGTVIKELEVTTDKEYISKVSYSVNVEEVFKKKNQSNLVAGKTITLSTTGEASTCGVWLANQTKYLFNVISLPLQTSKYYISKCRWIQPFDTLTNYQLQGIRRNFRQNCECSLGIEIYPKWPGFGHFQYPCSYDSAYSSDCYNRHAFCKTTEKSCKWKVDTQVQECSRKYTTEETIRPFH